MYTINTSVWLKSGNYHFMKDSLNTLFWARFHFEHWRKHFSFVLLILFASALSAYAWKEAKKINKKTKNTPANARNGNEPLCQQLKKKKKSTTRKLNCY